MNTEENINEAEGNAVLPLVSNRTYEIRKCNYCGYKWAYHLYFAAKSNAAECPKCKSILSKVVQSFQYGC